MPREMFTEGGYKFDEVASALQKCIRRGLEEDAVFWAQELESRFYKYVWRRLLVIAHEDVGVADLQAVMFVTHCRDAYFWFIENKRFEPYPLINAVLALCRAKKTRAADELYSIIYRDGSYRREIPDFALDMHTARGKQMGRGDDFWFEVEHNCLQNAIESPYSDRVEEAEKRAKRTPRRWPEDRYRAIRYGKKGGPPVGDEPDMGPPTLF